MYLALSTQLTALASDVMSDPDFDASAMNDLMARIQDAVPSMSRDDVGALLAQVEDTMALVSRKKSEINDELIGIQGGRKALNGYDHLTDNHKEQRLYRRA
jgi:hypothetical protein